jgi:hypothetical protein
MESTPLSFYFIFYSYTPSFYLLLDHIVKQKVLRKLLWDHLKMASSKCYIEINSFSLSLAVVDLAWFVRGGGGFPEVVHYYGGGGGGGGGGGPGAFSSRKFLSSQYL